MYVPVSLTGTVDNILTVYHAAPQPTLAAGHCWYELAHRSVVSLSHRYSVSVDVAAAVVATLSPAVRWAMNIAYADKLLAAIAQDQPVAAVPMSAYGINRQRAELIARTGNLTLLRGPKVMAFFCNLRNPHQPGPVTIDRHALRIWLYGLADPPASDLSCRTTTYNLAAEAYRSAAAELNGPLVRVMPHHVQATTWLHIRHS